jgi:hypothetical protein
MRTICQFVKNLSTIVTWRHTEQKVQARSVEMDGAISVEMGTAKPYRRSSHGAVIRAPPVLNQLPTDTAMSLLLLCDTV